MSFHLKTVIKKAVFYFKSKNSFLTVCLVFFAKSETDSISELIFTRSFSPPKLCFVNKFFSCVIVYGKIAMIAFIIIFFHLCYF